MRSVDPDCICQLRSDALDRLREALLELRWQNARRDRDAAEIRHLVRFDDELLAGERARRCPQDELEVILGVHGETTDLCALNDRGLRDVARLLSIAEEAQTDHIGRCELDRVPFEHDRGLSGVATSQNWW